MLVSAGSAPTALGADDDASAVLADCGSADLAESLVDSCLERVRVLDETDPSPQLQSLEAQLEQRATGQRTAEQRPRSLQSSGYPAMTETAGDDTQPSVVASQRELPANAAEPDQDHSAAIEAPAAAMPDARSSEEGQESVDAEGDRPPPGINDDQPPVADPPDNENPRDQSGDPPDEP